MAYARVRRASEALGEYPGKKGLQTLLGPVVEPLAARLAGHVIQRCLGFWVLWHTYGGDLSGLVDARVISRAGVYQQRRDFKAAFGVEVDDWEPEVALVLRSSSVAEALGHSRRVKVPR